MFICLNWMIDRRIWYWQDQHILFSIFSLSHSVHSGYCNYHTNFSRCLSHHICIYTQVTTICCRFTPPHFVLYIQATTELSIQPPQLEFLLEDFTRKLSHALISSTSKRKSFLKVGFWSLKYFTKNFEFEYFKKSYKCLYFRQSQIRMLDFLTLTSALQSSLPRKSSNCYLRCVSTLKVPVDSFRWVGHILQN